MITVKLMGGLGNQMFQFAAAMAVAYRRKTSLILDLSFLLDRTPKPDFVFRDFDLDIFNLPENIKTINTPPLEVLNSKSLIYHPRLIALLSVCCQKSHLLRFIFSRFFLKLPFFIYNEPFFEFNRLFLYLPANSYISGYFQSHKYFADIENQIREQFNLQPNLSKETQLLADTIEKTESVCINIRRSDFVNMKKTNETHGFCDLKYFEKCIHIIKEKEAKAKFFVFSDDLEWCKNNFTEQPNLEIVGRAHKGPKFSWEMYLMTQCKHFIIPNSSFAWWAAWLSQRDGMVLAPKNWFRDKRINTKDLFPPHWQLIDN